MNSIKSIEELNLPEIVTEIVDTETTGLIVVSGNTSSGKTTTIASMVDRVNSTREDVIVMLEESIEIVQKNNQSVINQKSIDFKEFNHKLNQAIHQAPHILVIGELLSAETVLGALVAADTGHLVITSIHAGDALQAIQRIVNLCAPEDRKRAVKLLKNNLHAVIHQDLVHSDNGTTRSPVVDVLYQRLAIEKLLSNFDKEASYS